MATPKQPRNNILMYGDGGLFYIPKHFEIGLKKIPLKGDKKMRKNLADKKINFPRIFFKKNIAT